MNYVNTKFLLNERPQGMPSDSCWILETENITDLKNNEILIEAEYLSIDPYMRGRMNAGLSYAAPVNLGDVMAVSYTHLTLPTILRV